jgi:hypothetical protein
MVIMDKRKENNRKKNNASRVSTSRDDQKEFETMSQQQNRHGKGRQQNGSDGTAVKGRGSNH